MTEVIYIALGIFTLVCASAVVVCKNPVYSAFALILSFFGLSGIYVMLASPFIAMIQILVYTGAIVVLFVYVVMLINPTFMGSAYRNWIVIITSGLLVWSFSLFLLRNMTPTTLPATGAGEFTIKTAARLLFTKYLWPFEVISIFLVVMIVAVFALAKEPKKEAA